jgi:threonine/homoserine/homoserine lactone efflux protein
MALGHALVEFPLILLIYFGLASFFQYDLVKLILNLLGGGMLIWLGVGMFRTRAEVMEGGDLPYNSVVAGVITSVLNPYFFLWWATVGSMLIMDSLSFGITGLIWLIPVHWICDLAWLSFVSILVWRTHSLWGKRFQGGLFVVCSLLLSGFGGWFLVSGFRLVFQFL